MNDYVIFADASGDYDLCSVTGGSFTPNIETTESRYFGLEELPPLSEDKNSQEQIEMCFAAYGDQNWKTLMD